MEACWGEEAKGPIDGADDDGEREGGAHSGNRKGPFLSEEDTALKELVHVGLGSPYKRGICAAVATGIVCYALGYPRSGFRSDGSMRPHASLSDAHDSTRTHFLLTPLMVGTAVFLFT